MPAMALRRRTRKTPDQAIKPESFREAVKKTDSNPQLVATAKFLRGLIPGDQSRRPDLPEPMERLMAEVQPKGPSTLNEIGKGAMQAWQALSDAQRRRRGADVAILFTDLVGFSDWALEAGDEAALEVLRKVGDVEQKAISGNGGAVVKRLGDGAMAVFGDSAQAVEAALDAQRGISKIKVEGYSPTQRAGVHRGTPRRVKGDYLGVDVNIAARVAGDAKPGEILVSSAACEALDETAFNLKRRRRFKAKGAPKELEVFSVEAL